MRNTIKNPWWFILKNPWFYFLLYFIAVLMAIAWFTPKSVKKIINLTKQETEINKKIERKSNENESTYFSTGYSANTNDEEKIITTAGIICILGNGNIVHVTMTAENVDGRMKETEETVNFLIKHQDEIFDDLIRTIVEAGQRYLDTEPKKEKSPQPQNKGAIKKKV